MTEIVLVDPGVAQDFLVVTPTPVTQVLVNEDPTPNFVVVTTGNIAGPQGPPGAAGSATVLTQSAPAGTWTFTNTYGRLVGVAVYSGGELVVADVAVTLSNITVTWATPTSGFIVVT